ncbi:lytic transglycosylase domain-containing protein [Mesorhizobium sp. WSM2239]|uniref:Lytic transglycosylase domain-containing protein n=2 Tax=unclassified Mesorhizobium TaxID=325217 RepID=A0AAU8DEU4_9HYPH
MPAFHRILIVLTALSPLLAAGCTTSSDMGAQLSMAPGEEVSLPESVSILPASADAESGPDAGVVMAALPGEDSEQQDLQPSAFARIDAPAVNFGQAAVGPRSPELDALITRYAAYYEVPVELVRRVVKRESNFRPAARNGPYWGLMQIRHDTARGMGYKGGASGLLDAETNLKYAVKYLRGAYITAGGDHDRSVRLYASGYYYDAKRRGLLDETGLGKDRRRRRGV